MNTEEIKTQFVTIITDIIDIYEKTSKFTNKDIDSLITNVVTLNKKNMLLKKMYDLEDEIGKLKMLITKSTLLSSVEQKEELEKPTDNDPQQVNEEKDDKSKKAKVKSIKKEEKIQKNAVSIPAGVIPLELLETPKPVVEVEDKNEKKVKVSKKKEEVSEKAVEEPVIHTKEEAKIKTSKKKKEEKVESPKVEEVAETDDSNKTDTNVDESQQPLHIKRKKIPKQIKTLVWNEYIGHDIMSNKCLCCKKEKIDVRNFHCGHVTAESKGGDLTIKNLRPICAPCNLSMGAMSMNEFTKTFFGWEV